MGGVGVERDQNGIRYNTSEMTTVDKWHPYVDNNCLKKTNITTN